MNAPLPHRSIAPSLRGSAPATSSGLPGPSAVDVGVLPEELQHQLLARIAREIKAPLGAVLGFAHLMTEDAHEPLCERHRRWMGLIEQAALHMLGLVNDTVAVAEAQDRLRACPATPEVDLHALAMEVVAWLDDAASQRGVALGVRGPALRVHSEPQRLRQVLLNLVSNGIKYNRPGGSVTLAIGRSDDGAVEIEVRDTGRGMTEAQRDQLFQPYNRLGREAQGIEGTGLGLCIVRQLVQALGGTLSVDSRLDEGSCFRVRLPAV